MDGPSLEKRVINAKEAEGYRTFLAETEKMVWCERWENDFVIDCFMIDEKIPLFFFLKKRYYLPSIRWDLHCQYHVKVFFLNMLKLFLYFLKIIFYICKLKQFKNKNKKIFINTRPSSKREREKHAN